MRSRGGVHRRGRPSRHCGLRRVERRGAAGHCAPESPRGVPRPATLRPNLDRDPGTRARDRPAAVAARAPGWQPRARPLLVPPPLSRPAGRGRSASAASHPRSPWPLFGAALQTLRWAVVFFFFCRRRESFVAFLLVRFWVVAGPWSVVRARCCSVGSARALGRRDRRLRRPRATWRLSACVRCARLGPVPASLSVWASIGLVDWILGACGAFPIGKRRRVMGLFGALAPLLVCARMRLGGVSGASGCRALRGRALRSPDGRGLRAWRLLPALCFGFARLRACARPYRCRAPRRLTRPWSSGATARPP